MKTQKYAFLKKLWKGIRVRLTRFLGI